MNSTYTQSIAPKPVDTMQYSAPAMPQASFSPAPDYEASQTAASHPGSMAQTQQLSQWGPPQPAIPESHPASTAQTQQLSQWGPPHQMVPASHPGSMPQTQQLSQWGPPQQVAPEKIFTQVHQMPIQPSPYRQAVPIPHLNMASAPVDCPSCGQRQMTAISHQSGSSTHIWAGILCLFTGIFCFIPYLMRSMKDVRHNCGHCGRMLATWHKSGGTEVHAYA